LADFPPVLTGETFSLADFSPAISCVCVILCRRKINAFSLDFEVRAAHRMERNAPSANGSGVDGSRLEKWTAQRTSINFAAFPPMTGLSLIVPPRHLVPQNENQ
jgi:hypothetical protein